MNKIEIRPMLGHESKLLNRHSKQLSIGKVQYQSYPQVKRGSIVKGKYIVQLNYNGSMKQGGMKRSVDGIKNWPSVAVHYLMKEGFKFDSHGNCYIKSVVDESEYYDVETKLLQAMVNLKSKLSK
jgi:hypothetical protein